MRPTALTWVRYLSHMNETSQHRPKDRLNQSMGSGSVWLEEPHDLLEAPLVVRDPGGHRRGTLRLRSTVVELDDEGFVVAREIVVHVVQGDGVREVLDLP